MEDYWVATKEARCNLQMPLQIFEVTRQVECSDATFFILLYGSTQPIKFKIHCRSQQCPIASQLPSLKHTIKIITDMYQDDCFLMEGLNGKYDCSKIDLNLSDRKICILLCEISFNLFRWKELGLKLAISLLELDKIEAMNGQYFEKAFEMLATWLLKSEKLPNLKMLVDGLRSVGYSFDLSHWTTSYGTVTHKTMDSIFMSHVAKHIQCHWKFVARLLGEPEYFIDALQNDYKDLYNQAFAMLYQWKRRCDVPDESKVYLALFDSVHCIHEHMPMKKYLKTVLSTYLM